MGTMDRRLWRLQLSLEAEAISGKITDIRTAQSKRRGDEIDRGVSQTDLEKMQYQQRLQGRQ